ncbi:unnamed protein product [Cuscuta campestris]|uniref:CCHC-type domain-containing protein n=1 Tax=Cuscuta campestris TaxID=132261 RepID=A0A484NB92_9ASTE|nr:unnamed protein product [Cuscuta campestris]
MSGTSSNKRRLKDLLLQSDNRVCADCGAPDPKWAKRTSRENEYYRWVCHKAGFHKEKVKDGNATEKKKRKTSTSKVGCKNALSLKFDKVSEKWFIYAFTKEHNHAAVTPNKAHFVPTGVTIEESSAAVIELFKDHGIPIGKVAELFGKGRFTKRNCYNHMRDVRSKILDVGDAQGVLEYSASSGQLTMASTTSSETPASSPASPHLAFTTISNVKLHVPIQLSFSQPNYKKWSRLFMLLVQRFNLQGFLTGSHVPSSSDDAEWFQLDALLQGWILSTITDEVSDLVISSATTASYLWRVIHALFHDNKHARAMQLEHQFRTTVKGTMTMATYCQTLRNIADWLDDVDAPVSESQLVLKMLRGLPMDLQAQTSFLQFQDPLPNFLQTRSALMLLDRQQGTADSDGTALVAGRTTSAHGSHHGGSGAGGSGAGGGQQMGSSNLGRNSYGGSGRGTGSYGRQMNRIGGNRGRGRANPFWTLLASDSMTNGESTKDRTSNFTKLEGFLGQDFRRWQKKMQILLTTLKVVYVLSTPKPEEREDETIEHARRRCKWENDNILCIGHILNGLSDPLFDIYQNVESAKELWDSLESKYMVEDASSKKFLVSDFNNYKMVDSRSVMEQYHELVRMLGQFNLHGMKQDECISVSNVIDKMPPSWKDYKRELKHNKDDLSLVQLGTHLRIEESVRAQESNKSKDVAGPSCVNMVEDGGSKGKHKSGKRKQNKPDKNTANKKQKVACWKCGKPGHFKKDCRVGKGKQEAGPSGSKDPNMQQG